MDIPTCTVPYKTSGYDLPTTDRKAVVQCSRALSKTLMTDLSVNSTRISKTKTEVAKSFLVANDTA